MPALRILFVFHMYYRDVLENKNESPMFYLEGMSKRTRWYMTLLKLSLSTKRAILRLAIVFSVALKNWQSSGLT